MLSARELEVMLLALVAELSAAGEFRRQRYLLWVGYNQTAFPPKGTRSRSYPTTPRPCRDRTYFSCRPPRRRRTKIRKGRVAFFGQNFGDRDFIVGCCI